MLVSSKLDESASPPHVPLLIPNSCFIRYRHHILTDEQALCAHHLAVIRSPVKVLLAILEGGDYPTSNLIKPYIGKMIDRLSENKPTYTDYRGRREMIKVNHLCLLCPRVPSNGLVLIRYRLSAGRRLPPKNCRVPCAL